MLMQHEDISTSAPVNNIRLADILQVVSHHCNIGVAELKEKRRFKRQVRARHIFFYAAHAFTRRSYMAMGRAIDGKDHATVTYGISRVKQRRSYFEPEVSRVMADVERMWIKPSRSLANQNTRSM